MIDQARTRWIGRAHKEKCPKRRDERGKKIERQKRKETKMTAREIDRLKEGLRTNQVSTEQWTTRRPRHSAHRQEVHNARNTLFSSLFTRCGLVKARNVHDRMRSENASVERPTPLSLPLPSPLSSSLSLLCL